MNYCQELGGATYVQDVEMDEAMENEKKIYNLFVDWLEKNWISGREFIRLCETNHFLPF